MITTAKFGLKKPEDTDNSDLRVWIGDNMEILDASAVKSDSTGGTGTIANIWTGTQAQYDALGTWDATTLYYIVG